MLRTACRRGEEVGVKSHALVHDAKAQWERMMDQPPSELAEFHIECIHGTAVLVVAGEVDLSNQDDFLDQLRSLIESAQSTSLVDLSTVTFFGSSGISALLEAGRDATQRGVDLVLVAPSPIVRQVLDATGLSSIFEIRDEATT
jgi:anti-sigma B factor antagonist